MGLSKNSNTSLINSSFSSIDTGEAFENRNKNANKFLTVSGILISGYDDSDFLFLSSDGGSSGVCQDGRGIPKLWLRRSEISKDEVEKSDGKRVLLRGRFINGYAGAVNPHDAATAFDACNGPLENIEWIATR